MVLNKFIAVMLIAAASISASAKDKMPRRLVVQGGTPVPMLNINIDASYDPRLDHLIPGYKVLSVVIINDSFQIFALDPAADKWFIKLKGGKRVQAVHDLRNAAPKIWSRLPDGVKRLIAYPLFLPIGAKQVIDLFVPEHVQLEQFTDVVIKVPAFGPEIVLKPRL